MGEIWVAISAIMGLTLTLISSAVIIAKVRSLEAQLELYDTLLQLARMETHTAHDLAQTTNRLVTSVINGEEARRAVQDAGAAREDPDAETVGRELLAQRIRYRHAVAGLPASTGSPVERE